MMECCDLDKIICDVVASFKIDHIVISDDMLENIRNLYLEENNLNKNNFHGKKLVKSKENFKND
ncbi:MAG: hypothetical protein MR598_05730 [Erysipelotrichaceae bacterium]|nr:hypothetical protein [Erysipelotrichaceae bacterium]